MVREIKITFTPVEEELYQWVLSKAGMRTKRHWGISEFIKDLLWAHYITEKTDRTRRWMLIVRELINSTRCEFCGGKLTTKSIGEKQIVMYCNRCEFLYTKDIPEEEKLDLKF